MADNVGYTEGSGKIIATDDVSGVHYPKSKIDLGGDGSTSPLVRGQQSTSDSIPAALSTEQEAIISNLVTAINELITAVGDPLQSGGNIGNSQFAVTQSGAWSISLPSGASTEAKQPALGTAGSPSSDVISVQGLSGGYPLSVGNKELSWLCSNGTAITTNTTTALLAAQGAGTRIRLWEFFAQNSSSVATWCYLADGSTKKLPFCLTQYQPFTKKFNGSLIISLNTALNLITSTTGANIEWAIGYDVI